MEVYRISQAEYAKSLRSSGKSNRWNKDGQYVIYTGSSRSLSTLELMVHRGAVIPSAAYKVMVISIADDDFLYKQINQKELPEKWRHFSTYSILQKKGSEWIYKQESLILKVPSAVIPYEYNFIINTEHPDFRSKVKLVRTEDYFWDARLVRKA